MQKNVTAGLFAACAGAERACSHIDNISVYRYIKNEEGGTVIINELLREKNMSRYRLSKESGVAMTTITDICNEKTVLDKCAAGTLYKIAKALDVTVDFLLEKNEVQMKESGSNQQ